MSSEFFGSFGNSVKKVLHLNPLQKLLINLFYCPLSWKSSFWYSFKLWRFSKFIVSVPLDSGHAETGGANSLIDVSDGYNIIIDKLVESNMQITLDLKKYIIGKLPVVLHYSHAAAFFVISQKRQLRMADFSHEARSCFVQRIDWCLIFFYKICNN